MSEIHLSRRALLSSLVRGTASRHGAKKWYAPAGDRATITEVGLTAASGTVRAATTASDVLVVVMLYGGFDGLTALPALGDPHYASSRPTIAVPASEATRLDSMFGLHPALAPLLPWWRSHQLAFVDAVGIPYPTLSHFQAQKDLGLAAPGTSLMTGWMNRALGVLSRTDALTAAQVGSSVLTQSLEGPEAVTTLWKVDDFSLVGERWSTDLPTAIGSLYSSVISPVSDVARDTLAACAELAPLQGVTYRPANGAVYPSSDLGSSFQGLAELIRTGAGVRLAAVEYGDWDFHAGLGAPRGGAMAAMLEDLASSLAAFATDLGSAMDRVTVVTLSEFGRRVIENGSGGTDHGHGNAMLVLGGGVNGGKIYGKWPGLAPKDLVLDGNLAGTTDYRSVLAEILRYRCGVANLDTVFPKFDPQPVGVVG
jgi:uncharacterized protein (DUF1501 family)